MTRTWLMRGIVGFALLLLLIAVGLSVLSSRATAQTLDQRVQATAATLRCPVCLNLSVADSPSPVAQEMRAKIRRELLAGKSPDTIRAEFVASYGEWILLSPPPTGVNWLVWLLPPGILLAGLIGTLLLVRRWTAGPGEPGGRRSTPISEEERQRLMAELARLGDAG